MSGLLSDTFFTRSRRAVVRKIAVTDSGRPCGITATITTMNVEMKCSYDLSIPVLSIACLRAFAHHDAAVPTTATTTAIETAKQEATLTKCRSSRRRCPSRRVATRCMASSLARTFNVALGRRCYCVLAGPYDETDAVTFDALRALKGDVVRVENRDMRRHNVGRHLHRFEHSCGM